MIHRVVNGNRWPHLRPELELISLQIYHTDAQIHFGSIEFSWKLVGMVRAAILAQGQRTYIIPFADFDLSYYISPGSHTVRSLIKNVESGLICYSCGKCLMISFAESNGKNPKYKI